MVRTAEDLTGRVFDMLTVVKDTGERVNNSPVWLCRCECGGTVRKSRQNLKNIIRFGYLNHCGCISGRGGTGYRPGGNGLPPIEDNKRSFIHLYQNYGRNAAKRGLIWELTDEEFMDLTQKDCFYCGGAPETTHAAGRSLPYVYNGIDRMNNSIGYTLDNCVPCCGVCNFMKRALNQDVFMSKILEIAKRHYGYT